MVRLFHCEYTWNILWLLKNAQYLFNSRLLFNINAHESLGRWPQGKAMAPWMVVNIFYCVALLRGRSITQLLEDVFLSDAYWIQMCSNITAIGTTKTTAITTMVVIAVVTIDILYLYFIGCLQIFSLLAHKATGRTRIRALPVYRT